MKRRIAWWAVAGAVVAAAWGAAAMSGRWTPTSSLWTLMEITCPTAIVRNHPLSIYVVLLANAATYALVGLGVESVRMARARHS